MYRNLFTYSQTDDYYVPVVGYSYISQRLDILTFN